MSVPSGFTSNEAERLGALDQFSILHTENEESFDNLVQIAARVCNVPMCLISLVAEKEQWFKANVGLKVHKVRCT